MGRKTTRRRGRGGIPVAGEFSSTIVLLHALDKLERAGAHRLQTQLVAGFVCGLGETPCGTVRARD